MKKKLSTIILILAFVIGLSLLLYPTISNYYNSFHTSQAVASYVEEVAQMSEEECQQILNDARAYNESLALKKRGISSSNEDIKDYNELLNVGDDGIMGYIQIPCVDIELPIYHGTDENVLQIAVGHLDWSSLPVGGESTHCVLSGHRGLPSAKLFTNLDELVIGDTFIIRVLNEVLTYEVDQILTVLPEDVSALQIEEGKDYCTLVTCTPYGVNSHRLLVRGHRIENAADSSGIKVPADAYQVDTNIVALTVGVPLLVLLMILLLSLEKKRKEKKEHKAKLSLEFSGIEGGGSGEEETGGEESEVEDQEPDS